MRGVIDADPISATRPVGRVDCNRDAMAGFVATLGGFRHTSLSFY
jgi:hypothetical protein